MTASLVRGLCEASFASPIPPQDRAIGPETRETDDAVLIGRNLPIAAADQLSPDHLPRMQNHARVLTHSLRLVEVEFHAEVAGKARFPSSRDCLPCSGRTRKKMSGWGTSVAVIRHVVSEPD